MCGAELEGPRDAGEASAIAPRATSDAQGGSADRQTAPPPSSRELAFHEAAHAVFVVIVGGDVGFATINPSVAGAGCLGLVVYNEAPGIRAAERGVMIALAGPLAASIAESGEHPRERRINHSGFDKLLEQVQRVARARGKVCQSDDCQAMDRLRRVEILSTPYRLALSFRAYEEATLHMMQDDAIWASIDAVAALLISHQSISGVAVRAIVQMHASDAHIADLLKSARSRDKTAA